MVHTGFVERVLAQNKKLFREKRSIQLHVAVNLCHMNFLQMNFQNKIWLKVKIPGSNYRGFSVYSATTLANFFLPRLIMRPSPLKSSRVYLVEISVIFSSATETPPCWIFLRPSPPVSYTHLSEPDYQRACRQGILRHSRKMRRLCIKEPPKCSEHIH